MRSFPCEQCTRRQRADEPDRLGLGSVTSCIALASPPVSRVVANRLSKPQQRRQFLRWITPQQMAENHHSQMEELVSPAAGPVIDAYSSARVRNVLTRDDTLSTRLGFVVQDNHWHLFAGQSRAQARNGGVLIDFEGVHPTIRLQYRHDIGNRSYRPALVCL